MTPIFYSFRRCPYAMRARMALYVSGQTVELREVVLRNKPQALLDASASATVPCLVTRDGAIDESLDIMKWALGRNDPERWLDMPAIGHDWITRVDGPFKHALDRTKYATRFPDEETETHRERACAFLTELDAALDPWLFGQPTLVDHAILPFVRQFAFIDKAWFDAQPWPRLHNWLEMFLTSSRFSAIMDKYPQWQQGEAPRIFPS